MDDLKFALRMIRKSPATSTVAILTLAIALGASTSIFGVMSAMLVRPLPLREADRLIAVRDLQPAFGETGLSWPEFTDFRAQLPGVSGLAGWRGDAVNLTGDREPERISATVVTKGFFEVLGAPPLLGRAFTDED